MAVALVDVEKVYEKNKDLRRQDVQSLLQWIGTQPHLPEVHEIQVIHFLHSCYYSSELTKQTIDSYFTIRTHVPEIFLNRDPRSASHQAALDVGLYAEMPGTTPEGYKVVFCNLMDRDPKKFNHIDQLKLLDMQCTLSLQQTEELPDGVVVVADMAPMSLAYIAKLNLNAARNFAVYLQEAMPIRLKAIHFINANSIMDKALNLVKPFLKKDVLDLMHMHTDYQNTLFDHVSKENIPIDHGGTGPTCEELSKLQRQEQLNHYELFLKLDEQVVEESKRPGPCKLSNDLLGVQGTFKKLDID